MTDPQPLTAAEAQGVLKDPQDRRWVRPVSWQGTGEGFVLKPGQAMACVPSARGGAPRTMSLDLLTNAWEAVTLDAIDKEQQAMDTKTILFPNG